MKKVGIITFYYNARNYGASLQAFALCKAIQGLGYGAEQISFAPPPLTQSRAERFKTMPLGLKCRKAASFALRKAGSVSFKVTHRAAQRETEQQIRLRDKAFADFQRNVIPHSEAVYTETDIGTCVNQYQAFVAGSDQIWNPEWFHEAYLLRFVPSGHTKLSYAASVTKNELTEQQQEVFRAALRDFTAVSVREPNAVELLQPVAPVTVEWSLDPTLLLSRQQWDEICVPRVIEEEYVFCYFLGEDRGQRRTARRFAKQRGLKIVTLPHLLGELRRCDAGFGDHQLCDASPAQFVSLIRHASYVLTDSFHATVFSELYQRPYAVFQRQGFSAMSSRIYNLCKLFGREAYFCDTPKKATVEYLKTLPAPDFSAPLPEFARMKEKSLAYLRANLAKGSEASEAVEAEWPNAVIEINDKNKCSGCHACASICPKQCIEMRRDQEGFLYPQVQKELCVQCGQCERICPVLHRAPVNRAPTIYAAYSPNDDLRLRSSSGGVFSLLAEHIIGQGGAVFGAGFDKSFRLAHTCAEASGELEALRGSKYVQSAVGDTLKQAKALLEQGRPVLYTGTPCQIGGLRAYLQRDYDNLYTQDIICHGAPSPMIWEKYMALREGEAGQRLEHVSFRSKDSGWKQYSVKLSFSGGKVYQRRAQSDLYMRGFLADLYLRPSCHACAFKAISRQSDLTLADFWGIQSVFPGFDDDKGASMVLVNSSKGQRLFEAIRGQMRVEERTVEPSAAAHCNPAMVKSAAPHRNRDEFFAQIQDQELEGLIRKLCRVPLKRKLRALASRMLAKLR